MGTGNRPGATCIEELQVAARIGKCQEAAGIGNRLAASCNRNQRKAVGRGQGQEAH